MNSRKNIKVLLQNESIIGINNDTPVTEYLKFCCMCGRIFKAARIDKLTCSPSCSIKMSKYLTNNFPVPFNSDNIVLTEKKVKKAGFTMENIPEKFKTKYGLEKK